MANLSPISTKISFKLDTGETREGKVVYRSVNIGNIDDAVDVDDLGAVASSLRELLGHPTESVTITRNELLGL
ncbi:MAG: DUF1659 domain-containing protein [Synergistaceae bacterium]|jgi:hypothetical protein|nr:DUF1659 domain-containing protein [Synergistaceae bacterium]